MNFSASQLVKKSASQLLYYYMNNKTSPVTENQVKGNNYANDIVKQSNATSEKRGTLKVNDDYLFFCIDYVKGSVFSEIKMVTNDDDYQGWYLQSSIIQATFYRTLLNKVTFLDTPLFKQKEGVEQIVIDIPKKIDFQLWFGKDKYQIQNDEKIFNHYINKLNIIKNGFTQRNFDECRKFDAEFKFKEFNTYKPKFKLITNK